MPKRLTHRIKHWMLRDRVKIVVVGSGGTGAALVTGLPYLHQALLAAGHPAGIGVYVIDGDRISETNCVRQPFTLSEVGLYKAQVLVNRLNVFWGPSFKREMSYACKVTQNLETWFCQNPSNVQLVNRFASTSQCLGSREATHSSFFSR